MIKRLYSTDFLNFYRFCYNFMRATRNRKSILYARNIIRKI